MPETPFVTILIIVWKSAKHFPQCINSLRVQTFQNAEIIILDNGFDKNLDISQLRSIYREVRIERLGFNSGFAVANNIGAHLAKGKWIALLNDDAFPQPEWLEKLILAAEQNTEYSSFSSKQIQYNYPNLIDGAGDDYHVSGLAWRNSYNLSMHEYGLIQKETFSSCAAAALYSREAFVKAGGFDEDYFSYFEDVDLGFRLRLKGEKCLYVPEAVVHHVGSASTGKRSDFSVYYGYRNMIWTFFKNMPTPLLLISLPFHILSIVFFVCFFITRRQGKVIFKAVIDALIGLPNVFKKRKTVQKNIKVSLKELLRVMSTGLFEPYTEFLERNKK